MAINGSAQPALSALADPPHRDLSVIAMRDALEPFRRKRDLNALTLLVTDLGLFVGGQWLCISAVAVGPRVLGVVLTWAAIVRLFIIGHDACHQALTSSTILNQVIGRLAFLVSLTPYSLWRVGHNIVHHGFNNLRGRDFIWEPKQTLEFLALPRWRRAIERLYRGAFGPPLYYFVEIWWKHLFFPNRKNLRASRREFTLDSILIAVMAVGWVGLIFAYTHEHRTGFWTTLLLACIVPFILWNWTVGLVVYLHHTHPEVRWYATKRDWLRNAGQVSGTVHIVFPDPFGALLHYIMEHPAHHLNSNIPLYNLRAANRRLRQIGAGFVITRFSLRHYWRCVKTCKLYDYSINAWVPFPINANGKTVQQSVASVLVIIGVGLCAIGRDSMAESALDLAPIVVTATRVAQSSFDLPASIDRIDQPQIQSGQLQVNISEPLVSVPGVSAESRQNFAQDLQLSVRGFGARSSFGVRGVRLYADGIPGTMPDGQGQFSQFDLGSADRIEVLRGPFSALYGNSSGGVIAIFTETAMPGYLVDGTVEFGSFAVQRYALKATGNNGMVDFVVDAAHFQIDGYRQHSEAERNNFNATLGFAPSTTSKLTLLANAVQTPSVQDPLGLTAAQVTVDPSQAGTNAIRYNSRKWMSQEQTGLRYENQLSANNSVAAIVYAGHRATTQFQAIPSFTEKLPTNPGGVIDLSRNYWGVDLHAADQRSIAGMPLQWIVGVAYDDLEEARKGYLNFVGPQLGIEGQVRRDLASHVYDFDQYLQAQWDPDARWRLIAGVRNNFVAFASHDHLPGSANPDSGLSFSALDPAGGVTYRVNPALNLYASYGKGFETPTLNDLAYRSVDGSLPGLNLGLQPARSDNYELGLKTGNDQIRANLAGFYIKTIDELAVRLNAGGKTVNENIGETRRRGLELAVDAAWAGNFSSRLAFTHIHAVTAQTYTSCAGTPCLPAVVNPGSYLPAVPMNALYAGLTWRYLPFGFATTAEFQSRAQIYADDRNTHAAPGFWVANIRLGFEQHTDDWHFSESFRIDNLANRSYIGSVIVNSTNSQYFEPAPGRTAYFFFNAGYRRR